MIPRLGVVSIRQKAEGSVSGFPPAGTITTLPTIPPFAPGEVLALTQGVRRVSAGNVYELVQGGTTGATPPTGTGTSIQDGGGPGGCLWDYVATGGASCDTRPGSVILVFAARGKWDDPGTAPRDDKGNAFALVDLRAYAPPFDVSKNALYVRFAAAGGRGHTVSMDYRIDDEATIGLIEVVGGSLIKQVSYAEVVPDSNVVTGPPVTATQPAVILVEFWLDGNIRDPGSRHTCVPSVAQAPDGTTIAVIGNATALVALSTDGYIQKCTAVFVPPGGVIGDPVPAGTYQAAATTDSGEGSAIRTTVVQAVDNPRFESIRLLIGVWSDGGELVEGVPSETAVQIDWPRGQDGNIGIELLDQEGQGVALNLLGGDELVLTIRQNTEFDPVMELRATSFGVPGEYSWAVPSSATLDLSGRLVYDVWATRSGVQRQVVAASYFNVTTRIRR